MVAAAADRLLAATTGVTTMAAVLAAAEETTTTEDQPEMFHHPEAVALEITAESVDAVEAGVRTDEIIESDRQTDTETPTGQGLETRGMLIQGVSLQCL